MRFLLITYLILLTIVCQAQTIKQHSIYSGQGIMLTRFISYEESQPNDTAYFLSCRDARYKTLVEYIIIKSSSDLSDIKALLLKTKEVLETEEIGTTIFFEGKSLYLSKLMGTRFIRFEGEKTGYSELYGSQINKLLDKIQGYELTGR